MSVIGPVSRIRPSRLLRTFESVRPGEALTLRIPFGEVRKQDVGCHGFSPCYVRISALRAEVRLSVDESHSIN